MNVESADDRLIDEFLNFFFLCADSFQIYLLIFFVSELFACFCFLFPSTISKFSCEPLL